MNHHLQSVINEQMLNEQDWRLSTGPKACSIRGRLSERKTLIVIPPGCQSTRCASSTSQTNLWRCNSAHTGL